MSIPPTKRPRASTILDLLQPPSGPIGDGPSTLGPSTLLFEPDTPTPGTPTTLASSSSVGGGGGGEETNVANPNKPHMRPEEALRLIDVLDRDALTKILAAACCRHHELADSLRSAAEPIVRRKEFEVQDFDRLSKDAWHVLNRKYSGIKPFRQYNLYGDAVQELTECIDTIKEGCPPTAPFASRKSGLETLRKIAKSIWLMPSDELGRQVRKDFAMDTQLEDTMLDIAKSLSSKERELMLNEGFGDKLEEFEEAAEGHDMFEKMQGVLDILEGGAASAEPPVKRES